MSANRICIVLEGGVVQAVIADERSDIEIIVVDYDVEGADPDELIQVRQENGRLEPAFAHVESIEQAGIDLDDIVAQLENKA